MRDLEHTALVIIIVIGGELHRCSTRFYRRECSITLGHRRPRMQAVDAGTMRAIMYQRYTRFLHIAKHDGGKALISSRPLLHTAQVHGFSAGAGHAVVCVRLPKRPARIDFGGKLDYKVPDREPLARRGGVRSESPGRSPNCAGVRNQSSTERLWSTRVALVGFAAFQAINCTRRKIFTFVL